MHVHTNITANKHVFSLIITLCDIVWQPIIIQYFAFCQPITTHGLIPYYGNVYILDSYRWGKKLYSLSVQMVKFTFLLAYLNLYPYPNFQTTNSKPELELHKPFAQLKLSALSPICMNPIGEYSGLFIPVQTDLCRPVCTNHVLHTLVQ